MWFVVFSEQFQYQRPQRGRVFAPITSSQGLSPERVYQVTNDELELIQSTSHQAESRTPYKRVDTEAVARKYPLPVTLGRGALPRQQVNRHPNANLLVHQLKRFPARGKPFRLLIINSFGNSLGDNLVGATALRYLLRFLQHNGLPAEFDIMLALTTSPVLPDFFAAIPGVNNIFSGGLTVAELGQYDGVFDFSRLITLPGYDRLPMVDFYLWWMGIPPDAVPPEHKRNQLPTSALETSAIKPLLPNTEGPKVLFNWKASVPLRSIPVNEAVRIAQQLLEQNPGWTLVLDYTLNFKHPRLLDLDGQINSVGKYMALIAEMDGMIAVDSFGQHVADAASLPTVLLLSSLPPARFPYYPNMRTLPLPGANRLPGWNQVKMEDDKWAAAAASYKNAWQKLDTDEASASLNRLMCQTEEQTHGSEH